MDELELRKEELPSGSQTPPESDLVSPATRRANFWLFLVLVMFAVALTVAVFVWMRGVVKSNGGVVDPHRQTSWFVPNFKAGIAVDFTLPTSALCFT